MFPLREVPIVVVCRGLGFLEAQEELHLAERHPAIYQELRIHKSRVHEVLLQRQERWAMRLRAKAKNADL